MHKVEWNRTFCWEMPLLVAAYEMTSSFPGPNYGCNDLVDDKGTHEDIYKFASEADIVVCCLLLNNETVRFSCIRYSSVADIPEL